MRFQRGCRQVWLQQRRARLRFVVLPELSWCGNLPHPPQRGSQPVQLALGGTHFRYRQQPAHRVHVYWLEQVLVESCSL